MKISKEEYMRAAKHGYIVMIVIYLLGIITGWLIFR